MSVGFRTFTYVACAMDGHIWQGRLKLETGMTTGIASAAKSAAADRYRDLARPIDGGGVRTALIGTDTCLKVPGGEMHFLDRRYEQEIGAAARARSPAAKLVHLELALRYAMRARDLSGRSVISL
jgi:hypothetical protein